MRRDNSAIRDLHQPSQLRARVALAHPLQHVRERPPPLSFRSQHFARRRCEQQHRLCDLSLRLCEPSKQRKPSASASEGREAHARVGESGENFAGLRLRPLAPTLGRGRVSGHRGWLWDYRDSLNPRHPHSRMAYVAPYARELHPPIGRRLLRTTAVADHSSALHQAVSALSTFRVRRHPAFAEGLLSNGWLFSPLNR